MVAPKQKKQKKIEVRVFLDGAYVRLIDEMVKEELGGNRSDVARMIIQNYFLARGFKTKEERLRQ